jgi:hypothetical protein
MALVVGINVAVSLRLLTTNSPTTLPGFDKLYPLHWLGACFIFISGVALLLAYPAKALTNPVFYLKFAPKYNTLDPQKVSLPLLFFYG